MQRFQHFVKTNKKKINAHLEVLSYTEDLMNEVLNTDDVPLAELLFDDGVGSQWHSLSIYFGETTLVYQLNKQ